MSSKFNMVFALALLAAVTIWLTVFTVDEREHVIKFRFGEIVKSDYQPGLHFKIPFVNNIRRFPDRILTYEESQERFLTGEKKNLIVDYFITWRIADPAQFYRAAGGFEDIASERLSAIIREGIKAEFSRRTVQEVVAAERSELMEQMLVTATRQAPELGLEVVDVRVMSIELSDEVSGSVYARMQQGARPRGGTASRRGRRGVGADSGRCRSAEHRDSGGGVPGRRAHPR